ncbi:phosphatase PAP2 family protein [Saccharothrix violaceirubra]
MVTTRPPRLARLVTEVLAPWVWVLGLPPVLGWHATHSVGSALLWGLVVGVFGSVIPMVVIVRGARKGRWDGHHVTNREGRVVPLAACGVSLTAGVAVLVLGDAPHQMLALALAMFAELVVCVLITFALPVGGSRGWKISLHAAASAATVTVLAVAYGPWVSLAGPAVVLVCWSRVALGDHTRAQVVWGAVAGAVVGGGAYVLLERVLA